MKEATEQIVAEKPKTKKHKEGTPAPVEGATETKVKKAAIKTTAKFRILDGVDVNKYRGQRQIVVKALQSLGEGFHTVDAIAAKCEGLVSKTPVEASAKYHLKGLSDEGAVEVEETKDETPAEDKPVAA